MFCLTGCLAVGGTPKPKPEPKREVVDLDETNLTVDDLCRIVERETFNAGVAKAGRVRQGRYVESIDFQGVPAAMVTDIMMNIETVYQLPIEDEEDAAAYANYVYEECIRYNNAL